MAALVEETKSGTVRFSIEVEVPFWQAAIFAEAMTGNDDDIVLAAETAMRDRIEEAVEDYEPMGNNVFYDEGDRIELAVPSERDVSEFLRGVMGGGR